MSGIRPVGIQGTFGLAKHTNERDGNQPSTAFLGHHCKTLLPITESLLKPRYPVQQDVKELQAQKQRQQQYYNQHR